MTNILIVYDTGTGYTKTMAEAVASGVSTVAGAQATIKLAEEATKEDLLACHGLIIGTPVHMGGPDWRVKKFIDHICGKLWIEDKMIGKVGGVFVSGGGYGGAGGGCEMTMLCVLNNLAELGMVMVPLPKNTGGYFAGGLQWGPYGRSAGEQMQGTGIRAEGLEVAKNHGANIARLAALLKGKAIFAPALTTAN